MLDSVLVEVGLGLALIFFTVASLIAALNEWLARIFDIRSKVLWKALSNLIDRSGGQPFAIGTREALSMFLRSDERPPVDRAVLEGKGTMTATDLLANTGVIRSQGGTRSLLPSKRTRVDRIDTATFTAALLEVASPSIDHDIEHHLRQFRRATARAERPGASATDVVAGWDLAADPERLAGLVWASGEDPGQVDQLTAAANAWRLAAEAQVRAESDYEMRLAEARSRSADAMEAVERAAWTLRAPQDDLAPIYELRELVKGSPLAEVIDSALDRVDTSSVLVMEAVGRWYDESMARLSELYRISSRQVLFAIGLLFAVVGNISAIDLVSDLRSSSEARESLVVAADESCDTDLEICFAAASDLLTLPVVGDYRPPWQALGWGEEDGDELALGREPDLDPRPEVVIGWLLTAFAVSFGAPFWFDVARWFGGIRQPGRPA